MEPFNVVFGKTAGQAQCLGISPSWLPVPTRLTLGNHFSIAADWLLCTTVLSTLPFTLVSLPRLHRRVTTRLYAKRHLRPRWIKNELSRAPGSRSPSSRTGKPRFNMVEDGDFQEKPVWNQPMTEGFS